MGPNKEGPWPFKSPEYLNKMSLNLYHFKKNDKFCDVVLVSGETKVKAHRIVLAASCEYFKDIGLEESQNGHAVVDLPAVPSGVLPILVDYIYTGNVGIDQTTVPQLLVAAVMLGLQELYTSCVEFLRKEMCPSNALQTLRLADSYNYKELAEEAIKHVQANWNTVASGDEMLELPLPLLVTLLSSEHLQVDSEAQVLNPALRWLEHDPGSRRRYCFKVLTQVRLPLIAPNILDEAVKNVQNPYVAFAVETLRYAMENDDRSALVALSAERRLSMYRVLLVTESWNDFCRTLKFDYNKREWELCAPMGDTRYSMSMATLNGLVYVVGGRENVKRISARGHVYDPQTDKWWRIPSMKQARTFFGLTECSGRLYALGGMVGRPSPLPDEKTSSIEVYDPVTWKWTYAGDMPEPLCQMGVVNFKGQIYVTGGSTTGNKITNDLLRYNPASREWSTLAPMRHGRCDHAAVELDGCLYVIGGVGNTSNERLASVERYNFDADSWVEVCPLKEARAGCAAWAARGVLAVAGGYPNETSERLVSVEEYDPRQNTWREGPALPVSSFSSFPSFHAALF